MSEQKQASETTSDNGLRATIDKAFLRGLRFFTFNSPIDRGRYRLFLAAKKMVRSLPDGLNAASRDGRRFSVDLSTGMQDTLYFIGEYERAITNVVERMIKERGCKTFLDVGANFGWYTTLFAKYAKNGGFVHSFEPVPSIFDNLSRNYELLDSPDNVHIINLALGESEGELTINLFEGLSTGHASLSDQGRDDAIPFKCRMTTLDSYLDENSVENVDLVKVDIEGAELSFLKGASKLFTQEKPPIILMEMALQQTKNFGYLPNDLIQLLKSKAPYRFFVIDEKTEELTEISGFSPEDIGANVICFPN